jgi:hypothetical protein
MPWTARKSAIAPESQRIPREVLNDTISITMETLNTEDSLFTPPQAALFFRASRVRHPFMNMPKGRMLPLASIAGLELDS